ncbi:hypothetical protein TorRG33x02_026620 [Trema orientale]|uniref:Uncharacterized protein n=1 Tax=Trema orientale TaxID=63057 RepID=A0A2P5FU84_TREOI|nr:hypothetical protein TorRG33x02_026620 [Trema orientale]
MLRANQLEIKQNHVDMMKLLTTLIKKKDANPKLMESEEDIMPDFYKSCSSTALQIYQTLPQDEDIMHGPSTVLQLAGAPKMTIAGRDYSSPLEVIFKPLSL